MTVVVLTGNNRLKNQYSESKQGFVYSNLIPMSITLRLPFLPGAS